VDNNLLLTFKSFEEDSEWFFRNYEKIKEKHKGEYVLIKEKRIAITAKSVEELIKKAEELKIDITTSVVRYVPKEDIVAII
jgi:nicotinic acid mononucleotide adenylyltransferase